MTLRTFLRLFFVGAALGILVLTLLPHDKYLRYQALNDGTAPTAYWIYDRIHRDVTPIDIAFIGTSRTGLSVHTQRLEEELARHGISVKAANLHIVKNGINMQYAVAKELLENRRVKLLVLEMIEYEDRKPHPDFIYLADPVDVVTAPLIINFDFFSDLVRLPGRELDLFLESSLNKLGLSPPDLLPLPYAGPNLDHAEFIQTLDGVKHPRNEVHTRAEMEEARLKQDQAITPAILPASLNSLEYHLPRYYTDRILELAAAHGTKVVFLYLPRYGAPSDPPPYKRYARQFDLINPWKQVQDYRLWGDGTHLNWAGAQRVTDYLADSLGSRDDLR